MKFFYLSIISFSISFSTMAQSNRFQLGPHSEFNNWLMYSEPNSDQFQLASRSIYDGDIWSYDWNNSLKYNKSGQLSIGSFYGFRNDEGGIGFANSEQANVNFFYTGSANNSGQLRLAYGSAVGSAMLFGINNSSGFQKMMTLSETGLDLYKYDGTSQLTIQTHQHYGIAKLEIAGGSASFDYSGWSIYHSYIGTNKDLYFRHGQSGDPSFILKDGGSVGIGTISTGSHKLAVDGSIGAREIKVEVGDWSDFVFENDYKLATLEEVENYISENKHLPEIPSEAEVTENGINLGEMDAKLLQKIEELTLYLIGQNKRMDRLESKNTKLEEEISNLKKE